MIWIVYSTTSGEILRNVMCAAADAENQADAGEALLSVTHFYRTDLFRVDLDTLEIVPLPETSGEQGSTAP